MKILKNLKILFLKTIIVDIVHIHFARFYIPYNFDKNNLFIFKTINLKDFVTRIAIKLSACSDVRENRKTKLLHDKHFHGVRNFIC